LEAAESGELEAIKQRDLQEKYPLVGPHSVDQLNGMFRLDYRLSAELESESVKSALQSFSEDFREALEQQIREDERRTAAEQAKTIEGKALSEIFDTLKVVAEKLGGGDADGVKLKNIREKIQRVVEVLPHFNVLNDKRVFDLIDSLNKNLGGFVESEVRENDALRKLYAAFAKTTLEQNGQEVPSPAPKKAKEESPAEDEPKAEEVPAEASDAPLAGVFN